MPSGCWSMPRDLAALGLCDRGGSAPVPSPCARCRRFWDRSPPSRFCATCWTRSTSWVGRTVCARGSTRCSAASPVTGSVRTGRRMSADGDERPAARDGGDSEIGPVQPRAADMGLAVAERHRTPLRAELGPWKTRLLFTFPRRARRVPARKLALRGFGRSASRLSRAGAVSRRRSGCRVDPCVARKLRQARRTFRTVRPCPDSRRAGGPAPKRLPQLEQALAEAREERDGLLRRAETKPRRGWKRSRRTPRPQGWRELRAVNEGVARQVQERWANEVL